MNRGPFTIELHGSKLVWVMLTDDELLLRYAVGGENDVDAKRKAGPFKNYATDGHLIVSLIETMARRGELDQFVIQQPGLSLVLEGKASAIDLG